MTAPLSSLLSKQTPTELQLTLHVLQNAADGQTIIATPVASSQAIKKSVSMGHLNGQADHSSSSDDGGQHSGAGGKSSSKTDPLRSQIEGLGPPSTHILYEGPGSEILRSLFSFAFRPATRGPLASIGVHYRR